MAAIDVGIGHDDDFVVAEFFQVQGLAVSKLTYPEQFAKYNRNVTLEGEAYFEIAENKKSPFQVLAENVKLQVTGTCFNVKAYASDKVIKTKMCIRDRRGTSWHLVLYTRRMRRRPFLWHLNIC